MSELKYCNDCKNAKEDLRRWETKMWYCGKHRRYITEHTCASTLKGKDCKDFERR